MIGQFGFHDVITIGSELRRFIHPYEKVRRPHPGGIPQRRLVQYAVPPAHGFEGQGHAFVHCGIGGEGRGEIGHGAVRLRQQVPDGPFVRLSQAAEHVLRRVLYEWLPGMSVEFREC